jgi:ribosomal protein RSM22 (predicted rRNA methylase)
LKALEEDFRATLDAIARRHAMPASDDVRRLAPLVQRLSAIYNDRSAQAPDTADRDSLAARLQFSFPRDVPKGGAAVRELVALDLFPKRAIRLLDLGAGLGAMTWGVARALPKGIAVEAELVDRDRGALDLAAAIAKERADDGVRVQLRPGSAGTVKRDAAAYDLVIAGQVLSELDRDASEEERVQRHTALVARWIETVRMDGALVIVEPALRDRTRHLHRLRAAILREGIANVFAPCLHAVECPMLARESDWCHEDLPIDLPPWLVPIARGAGLRYEGLTFSYLVLRRDAVTLGGRTGPAFREVSGLIRTKGKTERMLCGYGPGLEAGGGIRGMRLDRAESPTNEAWQAAHRGDILTFEPFLDVQKPRVEADMQVRIDALRARR